jgi:hypothetical protein
MKQISIGSVSIPLDSYTVGGTALLGIRESGKTYTAKGIAEQLLDFKVPIIVFDAIGVWRFLKVAGDGPSAKGFKVVVAGGKEPDLPLTPDSAPEIVRAAIRENIPLVEATNYKQTSCYEFTCCLKARKVVDVDRGNVRASDQFFAS